MEKRGTLFRRFRFFSYYRNKRKCRIYLSFGKDSSKEIYISIEEIVEKGRSLGGTI